MKKLKEYFRENPFVSLFLLFFAFNLLVTAAFAVATRGGTLSSILFMPHNGIKDHFMDFFNSVRDAGGRDVYEKGIIYPPLANLLFWLIARVTPDEVVSTGFEDRMLIRDDQTAAVVFVILVTACLVAVFSLFRGYFAKSRYSSLASVLAFVLTFSYPAVYCVERGNILLFAFLCTAAFVFFRDSDNAVLREISYIALAFAAAVKIYPALFGILLLCGKKYMEAARTALYGIILFFVPFFFYDGFASVGQLIRNVTAFGGEKPFALGPVSIENLFVLFGGSGSAASKIVFAVTEAVAVVCVFLLPKQWQKCFMLSYAMLNIYSASAFYAMTFALIPFAMFLCEEKDGKYPLNYFYLVCFAVFFSALPPMGRIYGLRNLVMTVFADLGIDFLRYGDSTNLFLVLPLFQLMFMLLAFEGISSRAESRSRKK